MNLLAPAQHAQISSLTHVLDALAVSHDPYEFLPALLAITPQASRRAVLEITTEGLAPPAFRIRRLVLPQKAGPAEACRECEGGALAELIKVPSPKTVHHLDLHGDFGIPPALRHFQSAVALPIRVGAAAIEWVVVLDPEPESFTLSELEEMVVRTRLVSITMDNLQVAQRLCSANLRIRQEIDEIAELQRALLPETLPEIPGLKLAASYEAVSEAGGDFYDLIPLGKRPGHLECQTDHRWALLIGDVSGHGPAAAVVMAMLHSIVHAYPNSPVDPAEVLAYANRHLYAKRMRGAFVTALLAFYDPATRKFTWCRAGHPPLVLTEWAPAIVHQHLEAVGDLPLGIDPDIKFTSGQMVLETGQSLLLYTDGVSEAQNQAGRLLDLPGLEVAISAGHGDAQAIVSSILNTLEWHTRGAMPGDDRTLLAIQVL